ncbi:Retrovirus-related Pol polyprotein from transposon TNT 1-94 [Bienertia sinuspersici]
MEIALAAKRKLGFVNGLVKRDKDDDNKADQWDTCNNMVISWIHNNVSDQIKKAILYVNTAKEAWNMLDAMYTVSNGSQKYKVEKMLYDTQRNGGSVSDYYATMKALCEEKELMRDLPAITDMT